MRAQAPRSCAAQRFSRESSLSPPGLWRLLPPPRRERRGPPLRPVDFTPQRVPRSRADPVSGVRLEAPRRRRATSLGLRAGKDAGCAAACEVPRSPPSPSVPPLGRGPSSEAERERLLVTREASGKGALEFAWGGEVYRVTDLSAFERLVSASEASQAAGAPRKRSLADLRRAQRLAWEAKGGGLAPCPAEAEGLQGGRADPAAKRAWRAATS